MLKPWRGVALAATLSAFAGAAQAQSILWWEDHSVGTSSVPGALSLFSYSATQATDAADFESKLLMGGWDLVIYGEQNSNTFQGTLAAAMTGYVVGGGRVLGTSWLDSPFAPFMEALAVADNPTTLTSDGHPIFGGLASLGLANPGWRIYAQAYTATGTAQCIGTTDFGGCAAILGHDGRTLLLSPLFDSYASLAEGEQFVGQSAHFLLQGGSVVPEPITLTLLGTGLLGVAAARRRRGLDIVTES